MGVAEGEEKKPLKMPFKGTEITLLNWGPVNCDIAIKAVRVGAEGEGALRAGAEGTFLGARAFLYTGENRNF